MGHDTSARYISDLELAAPNSRGNLGFTVPLVRHAMHRRGSVIDTADTPQGGQMQCTYSLRTSCLTYCSRRCSSCGEILTQQTLTTNGEPCLPNSLADIL